MSYRTYAGKSLRPGGGGAFAKMVAALKAEGKTASSAGAIAATVGREKYGKKRFQAMAKAGRKRAQRNAFGAALMRKG